MRGLLGSEDLKSWDRRRTETYQTELSCEGGWDKGMALMSVARSATQRRQQMWTHWDLNPGPSACEADVIPLHHEPMMCCCAGCKLYNLLFVSESPQCVSIPNCHTSAQMYDCYCRGEMRIMHEGLPLSLCAQASAVLQARLSHRYESTHVSKIIVRAPVRHPGAGCSSPR